MRRRRHPCGKVQRDTEPYRDNNNLRGKGYSGNTTNSDHDSNPSRGTPWTCHGLHRWGVPGEWHGKRSSGIRSMVWGR